jgi:predicted component of viral defense system (DUF524 family)
LKKQSFSEYKKDKAALAYQDSLNNSSMNRLFSYYFFFKIANRIIRITIDMKKVFITRLLTGITSSKGHKIFNK